MAGNLSDRQAVEGYIEGDRDTFAKVDRYVDAALRQWRHRLGSEERFIRADVHAKVFQSLANREFSFRAGLATYVSRIVCHTCIDYLRFNARFAPNDIGDLDPVGGEPTPEAQLDRKQLGRLLFRVIRRLPRHCVELWRMYLKEGLNYRQIGEQIGQTEDYVRRRAWECREKAKEKREKILEKDKRL